MIYYRKGCSSSANLMSARLALSGSRHTPIVWLPAKQTKVVTMGAPLNKYGFETLLFCTSGRPEGDLESCGAESQLGCLQPPLISFFMGFFAGWGFCFRVGHWGVTCGGERGDLDEDSCGSFSGGRFGWVQSFFSLFSPLSLLLYRFTVISISSSCSPFMVFFFLPFFFNFFQVMEDVWLLMVQLLVFCWCFHCNFFYCGFCCCCFICCFCCWFCCQFRCGYCCFCRWFLSSDNLGPSFFWIVFDCPQVPG